MVVKKILFGLVLVMLGIYAILFEMYYMNGRESIITLFMYAPFVGLIFAIAGLREKENKQYTENNE